MRMSLHVGKRIVLVIFISLIFISSSFQFLLEAEGDEPTEVESGPVGSEIFTATWAFDNEDDFIATETVIKNGEVSLQLHDYNWNQSSKKDFDKGIKEHVTISQTSETEVIWNESFESGDGGLVHGIIDNRGGPEQWEHGPPSGESSFIGTHSGLNVYGTNLSGKYSDEDGTPDDTFLRTPSINLSQYENTKLSFWHYYIFEDEKDGGIVEISVDGGSNWDYIPYGGYVKKINSAENWLNGTFCFTGNSSGWIKEEFDLSDYDKSSEILIRFRFATNGQISDYGWYIDDIEVTSTTYLVGQVKLASRAIEMGNPYNSNNKRRAANWTVIDVNNPVLYDGILTRWTVVTFTNDTTGKMKIFREVGDNYTFVNETSLKIMKSGANTFDCYFEVKAGDFIGWYGETAEIWANTDGSAYLREEDISEDSSKSNWTLDSLSLSISATGTSRYLVGTLTSQVFDVGSKAMWGNITWGEELPGLEESITEITLRTRSGNSDDTSHSSWSEWSSPTTNESGSAITRPDTRYIQFMATLTTTNWTYTPTLFNVSISYIKYPSYGEIETYDFIPDFVVQWLELSTDENLKGQNIYLNYSLDSGENWQPVPQNMNLSTVSVLTGKIRFRAGLSAKDTTVTPILSEMSLEYTSASPYMELFIEANKETAKPGDIITYNILYRNKDIGDAKDVSISLFLDENLSFRYQNSEALFTIEGNVLTWQFETVEPSPGNRTFILDTEVLDVGEGATISTYAVLNYTDIGGNPYTGVVSDVITITGTPIKSTREENLLTYYLLIGLIIAIVIVSLIILILRRFRAAEEDGKIAMEDVDKGIGYLVMEENPAKSYSLFSDFIDHGQKGLCITRAFPGRVKASYIFEGVSVLWLSRSRDSNSILPTNLESVLRHVKDFVEEDGGSVILLDGLEYLIVHNDFPKVLKLVHGLNELMAINDAILLIPLNPLTLEEDKVALLKRDMKVLG